MLAGIFKAMDNMVLAAAVVEVREVEVAAVAVEGVVVAEMVATMEMAVVEAGVLPEDAALLEHEWWKLPAVVGADADQRPLRPLHLLRTTKISF